MGISTVAGSTVTAPSVQQPTKAAATAAPGAVAPPTSMGGSGPAATTSISAEAQIKLKLQQAGVPAQVIAHVNLKSSAAVSQAIAAAKAHRK